MPLAMSASSSVDTVVAATLTIFLEGAKICSWLADAVLGLRMIMCLWAEIHHRNVSMPMEMGGFLGGGGRQKADHLECVFARWAIALKIG